MSARLGWKLAHLELDRAVLAAYGWPEEWAEALQPTRDERGKVNPVWASLTRASSRGVLTRLLSLNLKCRQVKHQADKPSPAVP